MAQIEEFATLKIKADTSELQKAGAEIDKTKAKVEDLGNSAKSGGSGLNALGDAADSVGGSFSAFTVAAGAVVVAVSAVVTAATVAAGALIDLGKEAISAGDEMNDLSKQANISVERLSVLKAAYETTGASLNEVISNAEMLSSKLAKQDETTGKVALAIEKLGVSMKDANGEQKNSLQLQEDIVVAASEAKNQQEAQALAVAALGTAYYKLRGPILDVKESQGELYDLMVKSGAVMSKDFASASDNLNDKLTNLKTVFSGIGQTIATVALPALTKVAEKVLSVAADVAQAIARITGLNPANDKVGLALNDLNKQKADTEATIAKLEGSEYANTAAGSKALQQAKDRLGVLQDQVREMNRYKTAADNAAAAEKKLALSGKPDEGNSTVSVKDPKTPKAKKEKEDKDDLGSFINRQLDAQRKRDARTEEKANEENQKALDDKIKSLEREDKLNTRRADQYKQYIDQNYELQKALEEVNALQEKGYLTAEEAIKARSKLNEEMIDTSETFAAGWSNALKSFSKDASDSAKVGSDAFKTMAGEVEGAIDKFIETGKFSFSDFARSVIADIGKIAAKQAASGIMSLLGGSSSSGGSGMWGSIIKGIGSLFGGAFAEGGDPPMGKVSLVGENGPELFVPKTAGTIIPNSQVGGGGVSQTNSISLTINGAKDPEETGRVVTREMEKLTRGIIKQELATQLRRGNMLNP